MQEMTLLKRFEKRGPYQSSNLFLLTHAELLEDVDEDWIQSIFKDDQNVYTPSNLNYPPTLPIRKRQEYEVDGPITEFGAFNAIILGEYMVHQGWKPHTIYTAPEMRCIQTAQAFIRGQRKAGFNSSLIAIEPALGEWRRKNLSNISVSPQEWIESSEVDGLLDKNYRKKLEYDQLLVVDESKEDYFNRLLAGFVGILEKSHPRGLMFVIHPTTYQALANEMMNEVELLRSLDEVKPCTMYGLTNLNGDRFIHLPKICPAFTGSKNIVKDTKSKKLKLIEVDVDDDRAEPVIELTNSVYMGDSLSNFSPLAPPSQE